LAGAGRRKGSAFRENAVEDLKFPCDR